MKQLLSFLMMMICLYAIGQNQVIEGNITDADGAPLIGVNVILGGTILGTTTDIDGDFSLTVKQTPPFKLLISYIGYEKQEIEITGATSSLQIQLNESTLLGQEVVVSASRVEENILESPVSIEKMGILDVQQAPAQDFYGSLVNYKNVDMTTQSFTFRSISLRGFNANGNTRMVQLIDGIDNQAPGLNFPVGNIAGLPDLDVESVELLPGASSALYGPNAINGIVLMNSKSPFDYQGLSVSLKTGVNHVGSEADTDVSPFTDVSFRYAKAFNDKFAFKVTGQYLDAEDWRATDDRGKNQDFGFLNGTVRGVDTDHNGVNTLGDETVFGVDIDGDFDFNDIQVSRTGFNEADLVDYNARSIKFGSALHYKFNSNLEGILQANLGSGQNVYTGIDRYSIVDFSLNTYKAELRGTNFTLRAYTTRENSGDSYAAGLLATWLNEALFPSFDFSQTDALGLPVGWYPEYSKAMIGLIDPSQAGNHEFARQHADSFMAEPGSEEWNAAVEEITNTPISAGGGALFTDKTKLYAYEGSYNFSNEIDWAEIIVGANFRTYALESDETLFALDANGEEFSINEYGGYVQASKKMFDDAFKLTGSLRYDKNENFDGRSTPRISGVWSFLNGHNIRASYQTGFRMPTTQDQYIDLGTPGSVFLMGGLLFDQQHIRDKYSFDSDPLFFIGADGVPTSVEYESQEFDLEQNKTWEIGYKSLIGERLMLDTYYYSSVFTNFSGTSNLYQFGTERVFVIDRSITDVDVKSQGLVAGLSYATNGGFVLSGNYAWNEISNQDEILEEDATFQTGFNTPEHKVNLTLSNRKLTDRIGFNVAWRWQDSFLWESSFGVGEVEAYSTLDFQVSYAVPSLKSRFKIGGTNILNDRYTQAIGNPTVGALWYASITFDELMN